MDQATMLRQLSKHGEDAGSDLNDGEDVNGWFGWSVNGRVLTATYKPDTEDGAGEEESASWWLTPTSGVDPLKILMGYELRKKASELVAQVYADRGLDLNPTTRSLLLVKANGLTDFADEIDPDHSEDTKAVYAPLTLPRG